MRKCWQFDPKQRPNFSDLVNILEEFLANYNEREPVRFIYGWKTDEQKIDK